MLRPFKDTLGWRIKVARQQRGLNQAELARMADINVNTMLNIEKDRASPRTDTLIKIMSALHLDGNYLLGSESD